MGEPSGFEFSRRKNGDVVITHDGLIPTVLRGSRGDAFAEKEQTGDGQELMARMTGNYKRGTERRTSDRR